MFSLPMPPRIVAFLTFLHRQFWHSTSCYEFRFSPRLRPKRKNKGAEAQKKPVFLVQVAIEGFGSSTCKKNNAAGKMVQS